MTNLERARQLVSRAREAGVADFCVCAGSRNSPLIAVLSEAFSFVDERSAAFFALGRVKLHGHPAAVVTTSGTAVAELLPATIEAFYAGLPLVLITADRPARFRGSGAPQTIEQESIFGPYAARSFEEWKRDRPLHINIEFDEPLIDADVIDSGVIPSGVEGSGGWGGTNAMPRATQPPDPSLTLGMTKRRARDDMGFHHPVVLIGGLAPRDRGRVREFALTLNAPIYAESLSGLRDDEALAPLLITAGERMLHRGQFDGVIRIGNVPTLRFWRDLDESRGELPVINFSALPFAGLSRGEVRSIDELPYPAARAHDTQFFEDDRKYARAFGSILDAEPRSELSLVRELSRSVPYASRIYLGNSLPIREWDLAATRERRGFVYEANRGANGIDGQLSTFFGWCKKGAENVAVVGDLTAFYDLNAPWIVPQLDGIRFRIVIINNGGGRIFSRVPSLRRLDRRLIENEHSLTFEHWAAMFGISEAVTELRPDAEASRKVWERYDELWR
jgi:2-succinyl-5-enolpyruvyl-6-hydroxy-3-cyclohexene-1-carboxylate synthase